jgi:hypothetical protein
MGKGGSWVVIPRANKVTYRKLSEDKISDKCLNRLPHKYESAIIYKVTCQVTS